MCLGQSAARAAPEATPICAVSLAGRLCRCLQPPQAKLAHALQQWSTAMHSKLLPCSTVRMPWPTAAQHNVPCAAHNVSATADAFGVDDQVLQPPAHFEWEILACNPACPAYRGEHILSRKCGWPSLPAKTLRAPSGRSRLPFPYPPGPPNTTNQVSHN